MAAPEVLPDQSVAESLFRIAFDRYDTSTRKASVCGPYGSLSHTADGVGDRYFYYCDLEGPESSYKVWEITEKLGALMVRKLVGFGKEDQLPAQPASIEDLIAAIDLMPKIQPPKRPLHKRAFDLILMWGPYAETPWFHR